MHHHNLMINTLQFLLVFSNHISDHILEKLAEEDSKNCIKRIMVRIR